MLAAESKVATNAIPGSPNGDATRAWRKIVEPAEPFLEAVSRQLMRRVREFDPQVVPHAQYALDGNGKHLRPTLVALAAGTLGKLGEDHVRAAVIIEMVHLATLVHDDVMDEAELRRGRLTVAAKWGNEIAVLLGDCLFAQAVKLAAEFPTPELCRAVAVAVNTVCSGEILQTQQRRKFALSRRDYFRVIEMKTAELFGLSCDLAAYLSGATDAQRRTLRAFGMAFGAAYQVYDDCMDLFGTEELAGKSLGTDLAQGKLTWPVLLAWERASAEDRAGLENLIEKWQPENLPRVNEMMERYGAFEPSQEVVRRFLDQGRQALSPLPESAGRTGLSALTDFLAQQMDVLMVCS